MATTSTVMGRDDLREAVRQVTGGSLSELPGPEDPTAARDPRAWDRATKELGLCSLAVAEADGGDGGDLHDVAAVAYEVGRSLWPSAWFATAVLAVPTLSGVGDADVHASTLPGIADGSMTATLVADVRHPSAEPVVEASRTELGWVLDGTVPAVLDGASADTLVVPAHSHEGLGLWILPGLAEGLDRRSTASLDQTQELATVTFTGTPARRIDGGADVLALLGAVSARASLLLCADVLGSARAALEAAVSYTALREQFGRPIGSFQSVKHIAAEMLVDLESAEEVTWHALDLLSRGDAGAEVAACLATITARESAVSITSSAIQVFGGIGFTWEHVAHRHHKRALASTSMFEPIDVSRERATVLLGL